MKSKSPSIIWIETLINKGKPDVGPEVSLYFNSNWILRTTPEGIEINPKITIKDRITHIYTCIQTMLWRIKK